MPEVFSWSVRAEPSGQASFRTLDAQFGDGYSQSAADGINTKSQSWTVSFRGIIEPTCANIIAANEIMDFLDARGGWESFLWTPPASSVQGLYVAKNYGIQKSAKLITVNATFIEVFR
jgi:phage-related protein